MRRNIIESQGRGLIGLIAAALVVGTGTGFLLSRHHGQQSTKPDSPIEWNKVQAVPARTPDAEDVEWQQRANALDQAQAPNSAADGADSSRANEPAQ